MSDLPLLEKIGSGVGHRARWQRVLFSSCLTLVLSLAIGLPILYLQITQDGLLGISASSAVPAYFLLGMGVIIYIITWYLLVGAKRDVNYAEPGMTGGLLVLVGLLAFVVLIGEIVYWAVILL